MFVAHNSERRSKELIMNFSLQRCRRVDSRRLKNEFCRGETPKCADPATAKEASAAGEKFGNAKFGVGDRRRDSKISTKRIVVIDEMVGVEEDLDGAAESRGIVGCGGGGIHGIWKTAAGGRAAVLFDVQREFRLRGRNNGIIDEP